MAMIALPTDGASEEDYYTWLKDSGLADDEDMMIALAPNDASEEDWGCGYWCKKAKAKVAAAKAKKAAAKKAAAAAALAKLKKSSWAAAAKAKAMNKFKASGCKVPYGYSLKEVELPEDEDMDMIALPA